MRVYLPLLLLLSICLILAAPALAWAAETAVLPHTQVLVSPKSPIPAYLEPEQLVSVNSFARGNSNVLLRKDAAQALAAMLAGLKEAGITDIYVNSGYRSFTRQNELHTAKVASYRKQGYGEEQANALAARWVLPAGESEHQTGLAVDLSSSGISYNLVPAFANTAAGSWLNQHCAEYGFIIRYTEEKEQITGVAPEPWHFRYVGADHAAYMREHNLCLEEYHALLAEQGQLKFVNSIGENRVVYYSSDDNADSLPGTLLSVSLTRRHGSEYIITMSPPPEPLFDVRGHWSEQQVFRLYEMEIISGYPDGSFRPNAVVSRGEFITILSRLPLPVFMDGELFVLGQDNEDTPEEPAAASTQAADYTNFEFMPLPYLDIDENAFYYQPLQTCFHYSLVQPMLEYNAQPQLFQPARPLMRSEAALLLSMLLNSDSFQLPARPTYNDVPPAAGPLYRSVELLAARGIFQGDGLGSFYPEREISRAEVSAIFSRLLDALEEEAPPEDEQTTEDKQQDDEEEQEDKQQDDEEEQEDKQAADKKQKEE